MKTHEHSGRVQTFIVSKSIASSVAQARALIRAHHAQRFEADETGTSWRFRQLDPGLFKPRSFRTFHLADGVAIVVGERKSAPRAKHNPSPTAASRALAQLPGAAAAVARAVRAR